MATEKIGVEVEYKDPDKAGAKLGDLADDVKILKGPGGHVALDIDPHTEEALAEIKRVYGAVTDLDAVPDPVIEPKVDSTKATGEMKKLGDETDQTGSVMANAAGNMTQDMAQVAGVTGTAGLAMGQFAEYAAEGGIALKNFATTGPLLLLIPILEKMANIMGRAGRTKTFNANEVDEWAKSLRDGKSQLDILNEEIETTGKLVRDTAFTRGEHDFLPDLQALGVDMQTFNRLLGLSHDELVAWRDEMLATGADEDVVARAMTGVIATSRNLAGAQEVAAATTKFLGEEADDATKFFEGLDTAYQNLQGTLDNRQALLDVEQGFDDLKEAADAAYIAAVTGSEDAEEASRDYQTEIINQDQRVADYAQRLGLLPSEAQTILSLIDNGDIAGAEAALQRLERQRNIDLKVNLAGGSGWGAQNFRHWLETGSVSGTTTNVTINAPRGTRPEDLIAAGTAYARRNGGRVFR